MSMRRKYRSDEDRIKALLENDYGDPRHLKLLRVKGELSARQRKALADYNLFLQSTQNLKANTRHDNLKSLRLFALHAGKEFQDICKKDLMRFFALYNRKSPETLNTYKSDIRSLYRWLYGEKSPKFEDLSSVIKLNNKKRRKNPQDMLTAEEIMRLANAADCPRDSALVQVLYESGARIGELLGLKLKDIAFDEYGARLIVDGKTGMRKIRIISSVPALREFINHHKFKLEPNAPLFYSFMEPEAKAIEQQAAAYIVKKLAKRAGISGKRCYCHLFRHTRMTHLSETLSEMDLKVFAGWSAQSNMPANYCHRSEEDVDRKILELAGKLKPKENGLALSALMPRKCPRCEYDNSPTTQRCAKCGAVVDPSLAETEKAKEADHFAELLLKIISDGRYSEIKKRLEGSVSESKGVSNAGI